MASFDLISEEAGETFDIPVYGDDGVILDVPSVSPVPVAPQPEDHDHKEAGCERCAGKFVYKRKPVRSSKPKPKPKPVVKPVKVKKSIVKGKFTKKS